MLIIKLCLYHVVHVTIKSFVKYKNFENLKKNDAPIGIGAFHRKKS